MVVWLVDWMESQLDLLLEVMMEESWVVEKESYSAGLMEKKLDPYSCLVQNLEHQKDSLIMMVQNWDFWKVLTLANCLEQVKALRWEFLTVV